MAAPGRMFRFRLALRLGCTVRELEDRLDHDELMEWYAFNVVEPIGDERADLNTASIVSAVINSQRTKGDPATIDDCRIKWGSSYLTPEPTKEEVAKQVMNVFGGLAARPG